VLPPAGGTGSKTVKTVWSDPGVAGGCGAGGVRSVGAGGAGDGVVVAGRQEPIIARQAKAFQDKEL